MNVAGVIVQRQNQMATKGGFVRHDSRRTEVDPADARGDRLAVVPSSPSADESTLKRSMVVLLMALPLVVLLWGLTALGVSAWSVAVMMGIWCAAEVPLLLRLERRRPRRSADEAADEMFTLGARAAWAEATLRRDEDRFHEMRSTVA